MTPDLTDLQDTSTDTDTGTDDITVHLRVTGERVDHDGRVDGFRCTVCGQGYRPGEQTPLRGAQLAAEAHVHREHPNAAPPWALSHHLDLITTDPED